MVHLSNANNLCRISSNTVDYVNSASEQQLVYFSRWLHFAQSNCDLCQKKPEAVIHACLDNTLYLNTTQDAGSELGSLSAKQRLHTKEN